MNTQEKNVGKNNIHVVSNNTDALSEKPPILLIHGSWGGEWMWDMYKEPFVNAGFAVHSLDLRGHGKSGGSVDGATMQNYVDDVHTVTEELGLASPIVIGHSMGGLVALMYTAQHPSTALIAIDPSPSFEVQKESKLVTYPAAYTPMDAGMPTDPMEVIRSFPDISQNMLMMMKNMLGKESGIARSERKKGISVPKEKITVPSLFLGAKNGTSVSFGIGTKKARVAAKYYKADFIEIADATHPGILVGEHADDTISKIIEWLGNLDKPWS